MRSPQARSSEPEDDAAEETETEEDEDEDEDDKSDADYVEDAADACGNLPDRARASKPVPMEYKRKAVAYWLSGKKKRLSAVTVGRKYHYAKSGKMLHTWMKQLEAAAGTQDKVLLNDAIKASVLATFEEAVKKRWEHHHQLIDFSWLIEWLGVGRWVVFVLRMY